MGVSMTLTMQIIWAIIALCGRKPQKEGEREMHLFVLQQNGVFRFWDKNKK